MKPATPGRLSVLEIQTLEFPRLKAESLQLIESALAALGNQETHCRQVAIGPWEADPIFDSLLDDDAEQVARESALNSLQSMAVKAWRLREILQALNYSTTYEEYLAYGPPSGLILHEPGLDTSVRP